MEAKILLLDKEFNKHVELDSSQKATVPRPLFTQQGKREAEFTKSTRHNSVVRPSTLGFYDRQSLMHQ